MSSIILPISLIAILFSTGNILTFQDFCIKNMVNEPIRIAIDDRTGLYYKEINPIDSLVLKLNYRKLQKSESVYLIIDYDCNTYNITLHSSDNLQELQVVENGFDHQDELTYKQLLRAGNLKIIGMIIKTHSTETGKLIIRPLVESTRSRL